MPTLPGVSIAESHTPAETGSPSHAPGAAAPSRPLALSPSRAEDFKRCPLLYRLRAIDRIPEVPTRAQVRGTLVHAVLEELFALPAPDRLLSAAEDLVRPVWERMVAERPESADPIGEDTESFLGEARTLVARYYTLEDPTRFDADVCEERLELELDGGLRLRGVADRIDVATTGEVRVVDYKTGRVPGEKSEATALFQMKFYALMLLHLRGRVPEQLRLLYLASGAVLTYTPDAAELHRFQRTLAAMWDAITTAGATGDFPARPGRLCSWCDHRALCPAFGGTVPPYPGWPVVPTENAAPNGSNEER